MNTWKVIIATLVIFGAGIITGGLLVKRSDHTASKPPLETRPEVAGSTNASPGKVHTPLPSPLKKDFVDRLDKELKLQRGQRERIEKIIGNGQEQAKRIWQTVEPDMKTVLMETRDRIGCELTPEQRAQFEKLLDRKSSHDKSPSTNSPSTTQTNSAALDMEAVACALGIKIDWVAPSCTIPPAAEESRSKALQTEPGS